LARQQIIDVRKGLFLVRYASAEDRASPPSVRVAPAPGSERTAEVIQHPEAREAALWRPGTCLVVRASAPSSLIVNVQPLEPSGSVAVSVEIEALTQGVPPAPVRAPAPQGTSQVRFSDDPAGRLSYGSAEPAVARQSFGMSEPPADTFSTGAIRVLGHIAGRGDVVVNADEWLAGPSAPSRIEGIAIEWPGRPPGLDLRYAVQYGKRNIANSGPKGLGGFAGSRGQALPIVGLTIELVGGSPEQQIAAEALFLGSPAMRTSGQRVQLAGPTRQEPLVGLRLVMAQAAPAYARPEPAGFRSEPEPPAEHSGAAATGRVRVFRGKGSRTARS
jgi:hypothetical protein